MTHERVTTCSSCGKRAPSTAGYCASCGASLRGAARHLGAVPAIATGAFVVVSALLVQMVVGRAFDTLSRWIPFIDPYLEIHRYLVAVTPYLFSTVGGALCAKLLERRRLAVRVGCATLVGLANAVSMVATGTVGVGLVGSVALVFAVAFSSLGGLVWPPLLTGLSRVAPFSWAARLTSDNGSIWCFAVVVIALQVLFLAAPWLAVWIGAGSLAVRLAKALAFGTTIEKHAVAVEKVAS